MCQSRCALFSVLAAATFVILACQSQQAGSPAESRTAPGTGRSVPQKGSSQTILSTPESAAASEDSGDFVVTLDFMTSGTGMTVTYGVGAEDLVTLEIRGPLHTYTTKAGLDSMVITELQPTPSTAHSSVTISVDGKMIGASSRPGKVQRSDTVRPSDAAGGLHKVTLSFQTEGSGMSVAYRVGTEELVSKKLSNSLHTYSTQAESGTTIVTLLQPTPSSAHSAVNISVDGKVVGGSGDVGVVGRVDTVP